MTAPAGSPIDRISQALTVVTAQGLDPQKAQSLLEEIIHHQQWVERRRTQDERLGSIFAFVIALAFLAAATLLVTMGHEIPGTLLGAVDIVGLVTVFVVGRPSGSDQSRR
jgi:hypothetical protein